MRRFVTLMIALACVTMAWQALAQPAPAAPPAPGVQPAPGESKEPEPGVCPQPTKKNPVMSRRAMRSAAKGTMMLMRVYQPQTVETLSGGVQSLGTFPPNCPTPEAMVHASLRVGQGYIPVYLSPDWFLKQHEVSLKDGDFVTVTGSKVGTGNQAIIIAKDIQVGPKPLTSGMIKGLPLWMMGQKAATPQK